MFKKLGELLAKEPLITQTQLEEASRLRRSGLIKVRDALTTLEEVVRETVK